MDPAPQESPSPIDPPDSFPALDTLFTRGRALLSYKTFNHCATICPHPDGAVLAFYTGREGTPDQSVVCLIWRESTNSYHTLFHLPEGTGNPVLWYESGRFSLLYSRFEDYKSWVWANCSLWMTQILDDQVHTYRFPARKGLLGRCPPIESVSSEDTLLLPLYHEKPAFGVIYARKGINGTWKRHGTIGRGENTVMQPTLWSVGKSHLALCRNSSRKISGGTAKAWFSSSRTGRTWMDIEPSLIFNNSNNSILVVPHDVDSWVVWNDDPTGRRSLSMAQIWAVDSTKRRLNVGEYAAYPNYCWVGRDLHLVWTEAFEGAYRIAHQVFRGFRS